MNRPSILCVALVLSLVAVPALAEPEIYTFVVQKQEQKKATRWSLSDWLDTRDRMRLMDLWLAMHSPTPYEFYIGTEYQLTERASDIKGNQLRLSAQAYARIFGLGLERGMSPYSDTQGLFLLRVFGFHAQGTNITVQGGVRMEDEPVSARNALAGVASTIYITKYFGIEGLFRHYFPSVPGNTGVRTRGNRFELGAFIDFSFLRILGKSFWEAETRDFSGQVADQGRSGVVLGTRLFF